MFAIIEINTSATVMEENVMVLRFKDVINYFFKSLLHSFCFHIGPKHNIKVLEPHQDVSDVGVDLVPVVAQPDVVEQGGLVEVHQAAVVINIFL